MRAKFFSLSPMQDILLQCLKFVSMVQEHWLLGRSAISFVPVMCTNRNCKQCHRYWAWLLFSPTTQMRVVGLPIEARSYFRYLGFQDSRMIDMRKTSATLWKNGGRPCNSVQLSEKYKYIWNHQTEFRWHASVYFFCMLVGVGLGHKLRSGVSKLLKERVSVTQQAANGAMKLVVNC